MQLVLEIDNRSYFLYHNNCGIFIGLITHTGCTKDYITELICRLIIYSIFCASIAVMK